MASLGLLRMVGMRAAPSRLSVAAAPRVPPAVAGALVLSRSFAKKRESKEPPLVQVTQALMDESAKRTGLVTVGPPPPFVCFDDSDEEFEYEDELLNKKIKLKKPKLPFDPARPKKLGMILFRQRLVKPDPTPFEQALNTWEKLVDKESSEPVILDFWNRNLSHIKTLEDAQAEREKELASLKTFPKRTNADQINDTRSMKRKLDDCLYFVVKTKPDGPYEFPEWDPPAVTDDKKRLDFWKYNEEKVIELYRPLTGFRFFFPGFHPQCVTMTKEKESFLWAAQVMSGNPSIAKAPGHVDFQWLTKAELATVLTKDYYDQVCDALPFI